MGAWGQSSKPRQVRPGIFNDGKKPSPVDNDSSDSSVTLR